MWRLLPLLLLPAAAVGVTFFGLQDSLLWGQLGARMLALEQLADRHAVVAALAFIASYAVLAGLCLPVGPAMGLVGGALFGRWGGTAFAIVGATAGALPLFLWARATIGSVATGRYAASVARVQRRLQQDGFYALLALRVAPVLPSWALNLGAAMAAMSVRSFVAATMLGLVPATAIFASIGAGLGRALAEDSAPGPGLLTRPSVLLPLLALSALALVPVVLRARSRRGRPSRERQGSSDMIDP